MEGLGVAAYRLQHAGDAAAEQDVDLVVGHTPPRPGETAVLEAAKVTDLQIPASQGLPEPASS